jgi:hypothetical protein
MSVHSNIGKSDAQIVFAEVKMRMNCGMAAALFAMLSCYAHQANLVAQDELAAKVDELLE